MEVRFRSRSLERCALEKGRAERRWGSDVGSKYVDRIAELMALPDWESIAQRKAYRLHQLEGRRRGEWAISLTGRWRLVIARGDADREVLILNVEDYHR